MAIDRDSNGNTRHVATETSLPAELLATGVFENLPEDYEQQELIEPIVDKIFSEEFITPIGVRMRALKHLDMWPFIDYQGSGTVWYVANNIVAKGLHRYGIHSKARLLEEMTLAGIEADGHDSEYGIVDENNIMRTPVYEKGRIPKRWQRRLAKLITTDRPQRHQAWTKSAKARISLSHCHEPDSEKWQQLNGKIDSRLAAMDLTLRTLPCTIDKKPAEEGLKGLTYAR